MRAQQLHRLRKVLGALLVRRSDKRQPKRKIGQIPGRWRRWRELHLEQIDKCVVGPADPAPAAHNLLRNHGARLVGIVALIVPSERHILEHDHRRHEFRNVLHRHKAIADQIPHLRIRRNRHAQQAQHRIGKRLRRCRLLNRRMDRRNDPVKCKHLARIPLAQPLHAHAPIIAQPQRTAQRLLLLQALMHKIEKHPRLRVVSNPRHRGCTVPGARPNRVDLPGPRIRVRRIDAVHACELFPANRVQQIKLVAVLEHTLARVKSFEPHVLVQRKLGRRQKLKHRHCIAGLAHKLLRFALQLLLALSTLLRHNRFLELRILALNLHPQLQRHNCLGTNIFRGACLAVSLIQLFLKIDQTVRRGRVLATGVRKHRVLFHRAHIRVVEARPHSALVQIHPVVARFRRTRMDAHSIQFLLLLHRQRRIDHVDPPLKRRYRRPKLFHPADRRIEKHTQRLRHLRACIFGPRQRRYHIMVRIRLLLEKRNRGPQPTRNRS
eukprot:comp5595_c0_seq1/m.5023 comp5595_c0_seq1/g.5023  ORF comp5595_c0_seq1/g.5023 comp5595_c0_seq1/m.5023 type:complete len:493 (-) comp5595_c0_seq1:418-1896(-)